MAIFPYLSTGFVDKSYSVRHQEIETIEKLRRGESFEAFKEKSIINSKVELSDEDLKKIFISYNFMDSVIKKIVSYCPNLYNTKTRNDKKRRLIKNALDEIDWHGILDETYDGLEAYGDMFYEIYFKNKEDLTPRLKVLKSKGMHRALLNSYNEYRYYIYKETVVDEEPSFSDAGVVRNSIRERIVVFEKGRKIIYDPQLDNNGNITVDDDNNIIYNYDTIENRESYKDTFPLIHIKGKKKQSEEFSEIPASFYIDDCLTLDGMTSDFRQINRLLGFPLITVIDGEIAPDSKRTPGGFIGIETGESSDFQAQVKDIQIRNNLESNFREFTILRDMLFDKVGLISPTLREKLNVDSSRVVQQLNLPSENKIELYVDNIIKGMMPWFEILLKENNLYSERTDKGLSFVKPTFIIKSSPFDELLYENSVEATGKKSIKESSIEKMDSDSEIAIREKEVNAEILAKNKDVQISKEVTNTVENKNGVDNNFKQT